LRNFLQLDIETLDQRTREAFNDVRLFSRRMWSAMEEKENKLFQQIIDAQQRKLEVLQEKYKNLNDDKIRLSQAMNALKQTVHYMQPHTYTANNPDDGISRILKSKDMVLAEVFYFTLFFHAFSYFASYFLLFADSAGCSKIIVSLSCFSLLILQLC